jgi:ornithine cyclodeaminase
MLILNAAEVRAALPMAQAIQAMKSAFTALRDGRAQVPLRTQLPIPPHEAVSLFMPAFVDDESGQALAVKVVSVFPHNPQMGLPLIHAAVMVLEAGTGRPLALMEGGSLTAIRTGAASGAATDLLARPDSRIAAIFGAGVQARTQLEAVCTVRSIQTAWIFDPNTDKARALVAELAGKGIIPEDLRLAKSPRQAVAEADVICTATTSVTPVFDDEDLKPGAHINGVGSYTPEMQEVPGATVARARVVVDEREAALAEAGDLIQPIQQGLIASSDIYATLGAVASGARPGRLAEKEITFFKSVGNAVQDAAAARLALANALRDNLGQQIRRFHDPT